MVSGKERKRSDPFSGRDPERSGEQRIEATADTAFCNPWEASA